MPFNKREIMLQAWDTVRRANRDVVPLRVLLRNALRSAWAAVKSAAWAARQAARDAAMSPEVRELRVALVALEAKDRWTQADYARAAALRSEPREAA